MTVSIFDWNFLVNILNPVWAVESFILAVICLSYMGHELIARKWPPYLRWTAGMRLALKLSLISIGICITRIDLIYWHQVQENGPYKAWQAFVFAFGGALSAVGFLLAVRVLSVRLFGLWPWRLACVAFILTVGLAVMVEVLTG